MRLVEAEKRALDGLYAYDQGATDSGVSDPAVRVHMAKRVAALTASERATVARDLYGWPPYTTEDVEAFLDWMNALAGDGSVAEIPERILRDLNLHYWG